MRKTLEQRLESFIQRLAVRYRPKPRRENMTWEISLPLRLGTRLSDNSSDAELAESCKRGDLRAFEH
ncbi:MAG: hypothetical protein M3Y57_01840, partial [Acidobacteriota bacterium]|nr:hypothetical protein [Acidobacteriota bacterium]